MAEEEDGGEDGRLGEPVRFLLIEREREREMMMIM